MVPSVSVLTEFHFLIKSNICQTVIQTSCESRTVSWKLATKTDCDVQELRCCQYSVDYIFCTLTLIPELMVEENCLSRQQCKLLNDCWIRQLEGILLYYFAYFCQLHVQLTINEWGWVYYEELWRSRRVLSASTDNTLLDRPNSSYDTKA